MGLDLSAENVRHLSREFPDPRIEFVEGDAESARWTPRSTRSSPRSRSSTSTRRSSSRLGISPGNCPSEASCLFDLIEGSGRYFERDEITYVREYSREEVGELLARVPLELVGFDTVAHDREHVRLLVVAAATSDHMDRDPSG